MFAVKDPRMAIPTRAIEVTIERVHVDERLQAEGHPNRIDPDKWNPLIMSFRHFYGIGKNLHPSRLAKSPEEAYAPWKIRGLGGVATRLAMGIANGKYRKPEACRSIRNVPGRRPAAKLATTLENLVETPSGP